MLMRSLHHRSLFVLCGLVGLSACLGSTSVAPGTPSNPATETFAPTLGVNISTMAKTANGVYYKDTIPGTGDTLKGSETVAMRYKLYLKTGDEIDSTRGGPAAVDTFNLSSLIPGVEEGMQGMRAGGTRLLVIPSNLAYGNTGAGNGAIPPNATLVFFVNLVSTMVAVASRGAP